jgi:hypothetical protein
VKAIIAFGAAVTLLGAAACSAPAPLPVEPPRDDGGETSRRKAIVPSVESEVGALDSGKVQEVFEKASAALKDCYTRGVGRIAFMSGEIRVVVRVGEDGSTRHVFAKDSTLGDRTTEACMLGVLKKQTWPKPQGGKEGNAETSFMFDPSDEERPPVEWSEGRMGDGYKKAKSALGKCRKDAGAGPMRATLYVETDGKAIAVGVSGADAKSEDAAACVVDLLKGLKFASPGSYAAKATVEIE